MIAAKEAVWIRTYYLHAHTDSTNLSETVLSEIADNITNTFGAIICIPEDTKPKTRPPEEAHEVIRPSYITNKNVQVGDKDQERLYELIWNER